MSFMPYHTDDQGSIVTSEWQQEVTRPEDGAVVRRWSRSTIDRVNQLEHTEDRYDVIVNGAVVASESLSRSPATRIYTLDQAVKVVESAGFSNVHACSGFTRHPATAQDEVFTVLGVKA